jgi:NADPH2:quinone reductase
MHKNGGPEVLQTANIEQPVIVNATDVLVRIKAAGVNPIDTKLRSRGTYYPDNLPAVLGCDAAGTVEAVGSAVRRFKPGDKVYYCYGGMGGHQGNYAEFNVVDESHLASKPATLNFSSAAAAPLVLITAWEALHDRAAIRKGDTILIHAGSGGVGHVAIQLAKAAGCRVITTVSTPEKAGFVKRLGADEVILYRETDFRDACLEMTGGRGVDVAFDTVGGTTFTQTFNAIRPYGQVVSLLQPDHATDWKQARLKNITTSLELMLSPMYFEWPEAMAHQRWILEQCATLFDEGKLRIHLSATLPLEDVVEAHKLIEQGGMIGKVVLIIE